MLAIYIPCLIYQSIKPAIVVIASLNLSPGLLFSIHLSSFARISSLVS